jgi:hypothetical protein
MHFFNRLVFALLAFFPTIHSLSFSQCSLLRQGESESQNSDKHSSWLSDSGEKRCGKGSSCDDDSFDKILSKLTRGSEVNNNVDIMCLVGLEVKCFYGTGGHKGRGMRGYSDTINWYKYIFVTDETLLSFISEKEWPLLDDFFSNPTDQEHILSLKRTMNGICNASLSFNINAYTLFDFARNVGTHVEHLKKLVYPFGSQYIENTKQDPNSWYKYMNMGYRSNICDHCPSRIINQVYDDYNEALDNQRCNEIGNYFKFNYVDAPDQKFNEIGNSFMIVMKHLESNIMKLTQDTPMLANFEIIDIWILIRRDIMLIGDLFDALENIFKSYIVENRDEFFLTYNRTDNGSIMIVPWCCHIKYYHN